MTKLITRNIMISHSNPVDMPMNDQNAKSEGCVNEDSEFNEGVD